MANNRANNMANNNRFNANQWSVSKNGLVKIEFISNIRNIEQKAHEIRRLQANTEEPLIIYNVSNSDSKFDINSGLSPDELYHILTIPNIQIILNTYRVPYTPRALKSQLVQLLRNAIARQPNILKYAQQIHAQHISSLRQNRTNQNRNSENTLLVSNQYKYKKSDFDGMRFKEILKSLFDNDSHLVFLHEHVLKEKKIPTSKMDDLAVLDEKIRKVIAKHPTTTAAGANEIKTQYYEDASIKADTILKHNTHLVLDILFESRRPFYIGKRQYTIVGYHQENGPTQDPTDGMELVANNPFVTYPVNIRLVLSDTPPDKLTDKEIHANGCHLQKEKIHKLWNTIWGKRFIRTHKKRSSTTNMNSQTRKR
jgi:hypothetical protein